MASILNVRGTIQTLLDTEMDNLFQENIAVHATSVTITSANYIKCELELRCTWGSGGTSAPLKYGGCLVWFLTELDGTNFESGTSSFIPQRPPDASFPMRPIVGVQRVIVVTDLPPGPIRVLLKNSSANDRMAASGNTLKIRPFTESI